MASHPPQKTLTAADLPQPGKTVPHRLYGWPITEEYTLDYARRHRLVFEVMPHDRALLGETSHFNYGDITDEHLAHEEFYLSLRRFATMDVISHFIRQVGVSGLRMERPVSLEWRWMLVVWSTRDYEEQYESYKMWGNWPKVEKFIDDALNECIPEGCERRTSLEWWWSCENKLVS